MLKLNLVSWENFTVSSSVIGEQLLRKRERESERAVCQKSKRRLTNASLSHPAVSCCEDMSSADSLRADGGEGGAGGWGVHLRRREI